MADENSSAAEANLDPSTQDATTVLNDQATGEETTTGSPAETTTEEQVTSKWPDDWRDQFAGEDEKALKRLGRFKAPQDIFKSYTELEKKLNGGEYKRALPDGAKPEDIAKWRADNGIPEKSEGYYDGLGDLVIGEADKPIFDDFFENVAHKLNLAPQDAKAVADWYYGLSQAKQEEQHQFDETSRKETEDTLREDWGKEYRTNLNVVHNLLARAPEDIREPLKSARLPDGSALFNNPDFLGFMVDIERQINPAATLVPNTSDPMKGMEDRITEIEKVMSTDRRAYNKDDKMQAELRSLYEAREKMKAR